MNDLVRYERRPELDKRIANGDDFAGDAYVRWVAVGHRPDIAPAAIPAVIAVADYQSFVLDMWLGAGELKDRNLVDLYICSTGLPGEVGEVCEKLKKYVRDGTLDTAALCLELGDVLYYLTCIAAAFDLTLDQVMLANRAKLLDRRARGTMRGSGDAR